MTDRQQKVFVWTLVVLVSALIFAASGCGVGAERVKLLQSDVAAIGAVAKDNPKLTGWDRNRLDYHVERVIRQIGELE